MERWVFKGGGGLYLVTSSNSNQLVAGPYSKDGAYGEVGVHDGGAIKGVKGHTEPLACKNSISSMPGLARIHAVAKGLSSMEATSCPAADSNMQAAHCMLDRD